MNSVIDMFKQQCSDIMDQFPMESRWDALSAILSEPNPFFRLMLRVLQDARVREGRIIRPLCGGITGAMLLGNLEDGGFLYNPHAGVGENSMSSPGWLGNEEKKPIVREVMIFAIYSDELPGLRAAALTAGLTVVDEFAIKGTVEQEQP